MAKIKKSRSEKTSSLRSRLRRASCAKRKRRPLRIDEALFRLRAIEITAP